MVLLDEVTKMLPGIQVHGFLDSPYWIDASLMFTGRHTHRESQECLLCLRMGGPAKDIPSSAANFSGFQQQTRDVLTNFNAWSVVSQTCYAQRLGSFSNSRSGLYSVSDHGGVIQVQVRRGVEVLVRAVPHGLREDILRLVRCVHAAKSCPSSLPVVTGPRTC